MKTWMISLGILTATVTAIQAQVAIPTGAAIRGAPRGTPGIEQASEKLRPGELSAHQTTWLRILTWTNSAGKVLSSTNVAYVELATGKNFRNDAGQWQETKELIESVPGGAIAAQGQHKAIFANNLNSAGSVELRMPDGQRLRSHVLGLSYFDTASGKAVMIAEVKDCQGQIVGSNQVVYADAFDGGFRVDVRYTYTQAGFEQDIILRERPPVPEKFGLSSRTTRIQALTEFLNPQPPARQAKTIVDADGGALPDEAIAWDSMRMGDGRTFLLGAAASDAGVPTGKQFRKLDGRDVLVEEVRIPAIGLKLDSLPVPAAAITNAPSKREGAAIKPIQRTASARLVLPPRKTAPRRNTPMQIAQAKLPEQGLVLDYITISTSTLDNYTFQGDTTYYISGELTLSLSGTTTNEGGAVVKFANIASAGLTFSGPVVWPTSQYRPIVFTSKDDNSVGQNITGSSGNPVRTSRVYLADGNGSLSAFKYARFAFAGTAVLGYNGGTPSLEFWHCQFVNCGNAVDLPMTGSQLRLNNVLAAGCGKLVARGASATFAGTQLTVDACTLSDYTASGAFTNSIFTAVTIPGNLTTTFDHCAQLTSSSGVYQQVGLGRYYLADGAYRNAGTTTLPSSLAGDLRKRTTYPPAAITTNFTENLVLGPQAPRDLDLPDLGYHYDPLDWTWTNRSVSAYKTLTLTNGVAVGFFGTGLTVSGSVISEGTPSCLNELVSLPNVQEQYATQTGDTLLQMAAYIHPALSFRFTDFSVGQGTGGTLVNSPSESYFSALTLRDCLVRGGFLFLSPSGGPTPVTLNLLNNVLERSSVVIAPGGYEGWDETWFTSPIYFSCYNNLFRRGYFYVSYSQPTEYPVNAAIQDNLFDGATQSLYDDTYGGIVAVSNNGFISGTANSLGGNNNKLNLVTDYQIGPLGSYYYPATGSSTSLASLINAGSRNSVAAGLSYHTTLTSQEKDTGTVDIGFHYVASKTPVLRLSADNGLTWTTITDGSVTDSGEEQGVVSYSGNIGSWSWITDPPTVSSKPAAGFGSAASPFVKLNGTFNSSVAGTLLVQATDTDFTPALPVGQGYQSIISGSTAGAAGTVTYRAWLDGANGWFGQATPLANLGPFSGMPLNGSAFSSPNPGYPYSITMELAITHTTATSSTVDAVVKAAVPDTTPFVNAGPDTNRWINEAINLEGIPTAPTGSDNLAWTVVSGPGPVNFASISSGNSAVSFGLPGVYQLRLTLTKGGIAYTDDVAYTIRKNEPPKVDAGPDRILNMLNMPTGGFDIAGTATDDYTVAAALRFEWWQVSDLGQESSICGAPGSPSCPTLHLNSGLAAGKYTYRLKVTDNPPSGPSITGQDDVIVWVTDTRGRTWTRDADFEDGYLGNVDYEQISDALTLGTHASARISFFTANDGAGLSGSDAGIATFDDESAELISYHGIGAAVNGGALNPGTVVPFFHARSALTIGNGDTLVVGQADFAVAGLSIPAPAAILRFGTVIGGTRDSTGKYLLPPFRYSTCPDRNGDSKIRIPATRWSSPYQDWVVDQWNDSPTAEEQELLLNVATDEGITQFRILQQLKEISSLHFDSKGDIWVAGLTDQGRVRLLRLDPTSLLVLAEVNPAAGSWQTDVESLVPTTHYVSGDKLLVSGLNVGAGDTWGALNLPEGSVQSTASLPTRRNRWPRQLPPIAVNPEDGSFWYVDAHSEPDSRNYVLRVSSPWQPSPWQIAPAGGVTLGSWEAFGALLFDRHGGLWLSASPSSLLRLDTATYEITGQITPCLGSSLVAIAIDRRDRIWAGGSSGATGPAFAFVRLDPKRGGINATSNRPIGAVDLKVTLAELPHVIPNSRSEGGAGIGTWTAVHDSSPDLPANQAVNTPPWGLVSWHTDTPGGSSLKVEARTAATQLGLANEAWTPMVNNGDFSNHSGRWVEVRSTFNRGLGLIGTLSGGASWTAGKYGKALSLDGADDYVQIGAKAELVMSDTMTISAWIYPTGDGIIVNKEGEYEVAVINGRVQWAIANSNPGWAWIDTGFAPPASQWSHVAVVYDHGIVRTYSNGALAHTYNGSGSIGDVSPGQDDFRIGGRQSASQYFSGRIDEVQIYNRALTVSEVSALYTQSASASGGLVARWSFDEGSGTTTASPTEPILYDLTIMPSGSGGQVPVSGQIAVDDEFALNKGSSAATFDVLANDKASGLTLSAVSQPSHGTAQIVGGHVAYTPSPGFYGQDRFVYTVKNTASGLMDRALVKVQVSASQSVFVSKNQYGLPNLNGDLAGATWTAAGKFGSAVSFNGSDQYLSVPNTAALEVGKNGADFSVSFWLFLRGTATGNWRNLMHKAEAVASEPYQRTFAMWMHPWDNRIHYRISTTGNWNDGGDSAPVPLNQWVHIGYVKEGHALRFYLNGALDSQVALSGDSVSNPGPIFMGKDPWYAGTDCAMDEVQIYSRALSATDIAALSTQAAPNISAATSLISRWKMDEGSGAGTASTSVPALTSLDGTLSGGILWTQGHSGGALTLNGTDGMVTVPDAAALQLGRDMTIAFWVKKDSEPGDYVRLVGKGTPDRRNYGVWNDSGGSGLILFQFFRTDGICMNLFSTQSRGIDVWYHVTCSYDGSTARIYIDGQPAGEQACTGTPVTSADPLTFGYGGIHSHLPGSLDEVQIYNRALTASEVNELFSAAGPHFSSARFLVGRWGFDDGAGSLAADTSWMPAVGTDSGDPYKDWRESYGVAKVAGNCTISTDGNHPPTVLRDTVTMLGYAPPANPTECTIKVLANDSDPDKDSIYLVDDFPRRTTFGYVTKDANNVLHYKPSPGGYGVDVFSYTVGDSHGAQASGSVVVKVAPVKPPTVNPPTTETWGTGIRIEVVANSELVDMSQLGRDFYGGLFSGHEFGNQSNPQGVTFHPAIVKVEFFAGSRKIGESFSPVSGNKEAGTWRFDWAKVPAGTYDIVAVATDELGSVGVGASISPYTKTGTGNNVAPVAVVKGFNSGDTDSTPAFPEDANHNPDPIVSSLFVRSVVHAGRPTVIGIMTDSDHSPESLVYQLLLYRADGAFVANVTPGSLTGGYAAHAEVPDPGNEIGKIDLSNFANGGYELELRVFDGSAETVSDRFPFILRTGLKLGQFTFQEEDTVTPTPGLPLTIVRSYDSSKPWDGDFGFGWSYVLNDLDVEFSESRAETTDFFSDEAFSLRTGGGWDVTLTLPDGRRTTFLYQITSSSGIPYGYRMTWQAEPGVAATLSTPSPSTGDGFGDNLIFALPGGFNYWQAGGPSCPIENFDIPKLILTLQDGTKYTIAREDEGEHNFSLEPGVFKYTHAYGKPRVSAVETPNGEKLVITPDGVDHYVGTQKTRSLILERNMDNHIIAVRDGQDQTVGAPPLVRYEYDGLGNLARVQKLVDKQNRTYETTTYKYGESSMPPHFITSILDPRGVQVASNTYYADGKLKDITDPENRKTTFTYDYVGPFAPGAVVRQTIKDHENRETKHEADARGNVARTTDARSIITDRTFDTRNNLASETVNSGSSPTLAYTHSLSYASENSQLPEFNRVTARVTTQPGGAIKTREDFNTRGGVQFSVEARNYVEGQTANGNSVLFYTEQEYDAAGNPLWTKAWSRSAPNATPTSTLLSENTYYNSTETTPGLLKESKDALGHRTTYAYYTTTTADGRYGDLMEVIQKESNGTILSKTSYKYDPNTGNRKSETRWKKDGGENWNIEYAMTQFEYDARGRLVKTTDALGGVSTTTYNSAGSVASSTNRYGASTSYIYDAMGRLVQTTYPDNTIARSVTYYGTTAGISGNARQTVQEDRHFAGDPVSGSRTVYDEVGRAIRTERLNNVVIALELAGEVGKTTFTGAGVSSFTQTTYDFAGRVNMSCDTNGKWTKYYYDSAGRQTEVHAFVTPAGADDPGVTVTTAQTYDANGNVLTTQDPNVNSTAFIYDNFNRRTQTTLPPGNVSTITSYDVLGRVIQEQDADGILKNLSYDGAGRVIQVVNAVGTGNATTTEFQYDELGSLKSQKDALLHTTSFEYDALGRRTKRYLPTGISETWDYDVAEFGDSPAAGQRINKVRHTDFKSQQLLTTFDPMGRLDLKKQGSAVLADFDYAPTGQRTRMRDNLNTAAPRETRYAYDERGRLRVKQSPQGTLSYGYDAAGNVTEISARNGYVFRDVQPWLFGAANQSLNCRPAGAYMSYTYDGRNRLFKVFGDSAQTLTRATYTYNAAGSLSTMAYGNGVNSTYAYNARHQLRSLTAQGGALASFDYDNSSWPSGRLSNSGRRNRLVEAINGGASRQVDYSYDSLNRLTQEAINGTSATAGYAYDAVGNRLTRTANNFAGVLPRTYAAYNANDWLGNTASPVSGQVSAQFDANGNTVLFDLDASGPPYWDQSSDSYDLENRLTTATRANGTVSLVYDGDGNRVKKNVNGTITYYLVDDRNPTGYAQVLEEQTTSGGAPTVRYTYGLDLINQDRGGTLSYYGYDGQGTVRYLTTASATVSDTYTYDAFGIQIASTGSTPNNYRYAGEQWDADLGMYYLRARYYQPELGRFWTMDTFEGTQTDPLSLHKYLYAHANPVNGVDPSGHEFTLLGLNVSQAISGGLQAMRVGGIAVAKRVAINSLYGSIIGGAAGQWDAILGGEDPWEGLQNGAMGGALFGGLGSFRAIQPVLQAIGIGLGTVGTIEAASDGHYAQAGFRGIMTALGGFTAKYFRTIEGDSLQPRSLSNAQARQWYHDQLGKIPSQVDSAGSWQTKAMQAFTGRFMSLLRARELMSDQAAAGRLPPPKTLSQLVRKAYQKGLTGDAMWKSIYESSMRSNAGVDARFQYGDAAVPFYLWDVGGDE